MAWNGLSIFVDITNSCNRKCSFCYREKGDLFIPSSCITKISALAKEAEKRGIRLINFWIMGGEPLLNIETIICLEHKEIVKRFRNRLIFTGLDEEIYDLLLSIDPKVFNICYHVGVFDQQKVEKDLYFIRGTGYHISRILMVMDDDNLRRVEDYLRLCEHFQLHPALLPPMQGYQLDYGKVEECFEKIFNFLFSIQHDLFYPNDFLLQKPYTWEIVTDSRRYDFDRIEEMPFPDWYEVWECDIDLHIAADGETVYEHLAAPLPFTFSKFFESFKQGKILDTHLYRHLRKEQLKCKTCPWLFWCSGGHPGSAYMVSGNPLAEWVLCDFYRDFVFPRLYKYVKQYRQTNYYKKKTKALGYTEEQLKVIWNKMEEWVRDHGYKKI